MKALPHGDDDGSGGGRSGSKIGVAITVCCPSMLSLQGLEIDYLSSRC